MKNKKKQNPSQGFAGTFAFIVSSLLVFSALTLPVTSAAAAGAPDLSGNWKVHLSVASNESDQDCNFTQKEKELSGTCKLDSDKDPVKVAGSLDGNKVTWKINSEYNGSPITLIYTATVDDAGKFTGSVEVQPYGVTGEFTAVKAK